MNPHLQRALLLLGQSRYDLAKTELHKLLGEDPDNGFAHSVLAICLASTDDLGAARQESELAIHLAADEPFVFYAHSMVCAARNEYADAKVAAESAIGIDPYDERYFAQLARVEFDLQNWQAALDAAENGLELDAENTQCINLRAMALIKLGKSIEAQGALGSALERAPEDAFSHANMGWSHLEQSKPHEAMKHFQEALRLEPEMEWARTGIVEAMKARHLVYRLMLNWFLWMGKLRQKMQFTVVIGSYIGYRILASIAENQPGLAPFIWPLMVLYIVFAVMTWLASPLFNLVLRTSRFGRLALSDEERRTSTWVGVCVLGAVSMLAMYFWSGSFVYLGAALVSALTIPPISRIYACSEGWPRAAIILISIALGALSLVICFSFGVGKAIGGQIGEAMIGIGYKFILPHIYMSVAMQFGVGVLTSARPQPNRRLTRLTWIGGSVLVAVLGLGVAGYSGLKLLSAVRPPMVLFNQPIRITIVPRDDLVWSNPAALQSDCDVALENGFEIVGDYSYDGMPKLKVRLLCNEQNDTWIELAEADQLPYMAMISSAFEDDRLFTLSNGPDVSFKPRPGEVGETMDVSFAELYAAFLEKRPQESLVQIEAGKLLDLIANNYHADVDFLFSRGGPTPAEFEALLDDGKSLSQESLDACAFIWRQQASEALSDYAIQEVVKQSATTVEASTMFCVHDLMSVYAIHEVIEDHSIKHEDFARVEAFRQISEHEEGKREWFTGFAKKLRRVKLLGSIETPIPVDVYVIE